jgi:hypothetical protein
VKHIIPIAEEKEEKIVCANLIVYPGDIEEYYTFISAEA